jgi:hypothetical protein
MTEFERGARAIFDYLLYRTANNYHGDPKIQKECDKENEIIASWAEDALDEVSEDSCSEWLQIIDLKNEIILLKEENTKLNNQLNKDV